MPDPRTLVTPEKATPWRLTGRLATRVGWRGRLILRVEEARTVERHFLMTGELQHAHVESRWRDAAHGDVGSRLYFTPANAPEAPR